MKNKIIALVLVLGVILIMGLTVFSGCENELIEQDEEMVELKTWVFTSGVPNNLITVKHSDENAKFELRVDKGMFGAQYSHSATVGNGDTVFWIEHDTQSDETVQLAYVDVIAKVDDNIVGYAVIKITEKENEAGYNAVVLKSVVFPKVANEYQKVTQKQVEERIKVALYEGFYSLQEAYDSGLLSVKDLKYIANHLNNGTFPEDILNEKTENKIKEIAAKNMHNDKDVIAKAEDFHVRYYGTYGDCVAVMVRNVNFEYPAMDYDITVEVAGVSFHYHNPRVIEVWIEK